MIFEGWVRLYEENSTKKGWMYSFPYSMFIYPLKSAADERDFDVESKLLGVFPIKFDIVNGKLVFMESEGVPDPPLPPIEAEEVDLEEEPEVLFSDLNLGELKNILGEDIEVYG